MPRVVHLVLSAGLSTRMGATKALLPLAGSTVLRRILAEAAASQASGSLVVTGHDADRVAEEARKAGAAVVHNPRYESGQTGSLKAGLRALPPGAAAFLLHPVDFVGAGRDDLDALIDVYANHPAPAGLIVAPTHAGRRGHPVLFDSRCVRDFLALADDEPAHRVIRARGDRVVHVPRENPWIVRDLDTPDDHRDAVAAFGP